MCNEAEKTGLSVAASEFWALSPIGIGWKVTTMRRALKLFLERLRAMSGPAHRYYYGLDLIPREKSRAARIFRRLRTGR